MQATFDRLFGAVSKVVLGLTALGAIVVLVQTFWITYGVFMRYVMNKPDRYVTEATALLLVPVAFAGLAFALKEDAYPKVTMVVERLPQAAQRFVAVLNLVIMIGIGTFFAAAAIYATYRSYSSGSASEILDWPRVYFWFPVAFSLVTFNIYAALLLIRKFLDGATPREPAPANPETEG